MVVAVDRSSVCYFLLMIHRLIMIIEPLASFLANLSEREPSLPHYRFSIKRENRSRSEALYAETSGRCWKRCQANEAECYRLSDVFWLIGDYNRHHCVSQNIRIASRERERAACWFPIWSHIAGSAHRFHIVTLVWTKHSQWGHRRNLRATHRGVSVIGFLKLNH